MEIKNENLGDMKNIITTVFFASFMGFGAFGQTASMPGGAPQDVVFRGFDNVIFVQDNEGLNRKFNVTVEGGELKVLQANDGTTSEGRYVLYPGKERTVVLIITDNEGNEMNRYDYEVSRVPDVGVQFATEDGTFSMEEPKLTLKNDVFPYFEKLSEITSWTVLKDGVTIGQGKGSEIDMLTMGQISLFPDGASFEVNVTMVDLNGITRIRSIVCKK